MQRFIRVIFFALLVFIPFGTRKFIFDLGVPAGFYGMVFLYAADMAALVLCILVCSFEIKNQKSPPEADPPLEEKIKTANENLKLCFLFLFIALVGISVFFATSKPFAIYSFARLALYIGLALAIAKILRMGIVKMDIVLGIFAASAALQSVIGFLQFAAQKSLGLWWLGEPALKVGEAGVATIVVSGARFLRAYGTFPHPNVLGAYLVLGLVACMSLWASLSTNSESCTNKRMLTLFVNSYWIRYSLMAGAMFLILLGLALTFSRAAWIAAAIVIVMTLFQKSKIKNQSDREKLKNYEAVLIICLAIIFIFFILNRFILARSEFLSGEPAVADRLAYDRLGLKIIKEHPLGVGIGNQVLFATNAGLYEKFGLIKPWQKEPIHNLYLLMASEIGIMGAAVFIIFIILLFWRALGTGHWGLGVPELMFFAMLFSGFFDHFLWDLPQGQLMLWIVIGLTYAQTNANYTRTHADHTPTDAENTKLD